MRKLKVLDLFSGIGGFSLGLERTGGFETVAFCEIEEFPRKVLKKHWPEIECYEDVRELNGKEITDKHGRIDIITGGFPCQDISLAGKGEGLNGERSGLWSECARLIREIRPSYAIFENVPNLLNGEGGGWFKRVLWDISKIGYDAEWHCIPASAIGARHRRDRIWIITYPKGKYCDVCESIREPGEKNARKLRGNNIKGSIPNTTSVRLQGPGQLIKSLNTEAVKNGETIKFINGSFCDFWKAEPGMGRVADGVPDTVQRLKGFGNAVVPQIPELIGYAILENENKNENNKRFCRCCKD